MPPVSPKTLQMDVQDTSLHSPNRSSSLPAAKQEVFPGKGTAQEGWSRGKLCWQDRQAAVGSGTGSLAFGEQPAGGRQVLGGAGQDTSAVAACPREGTWRGPTCGAAQPDTPGPACEAPVPPAHSKPETIQFFSPCMK